MSQSTGQSGDGPPNIAALLGSADSTCATLLIEGPAGIGKSFHWSSVVASASAAGVRVLQARPSLSESLLVGSALIDLCDGVSDGELDTVLPSPQRAALTAALLREPGTGELEPRSVAVSFTTLVTGLATNAPLLIAVDDIQWLDAQTDDVLRFAIRRAPAGLVVVAAWRREPGASEPRLISAMADRGMHRWPVPPLPPGDVEGLLRQRLGRVPAPVIRRAVALSGGNPLFALEVASSLMTSSSSAPLDEIALPASLREIVDRQLSVLPERTALALAATAALRRPELEHLEALGLVDALAAAERICVVDVQDSQILFAHPLYEAGAYDRLTGTERMALHRTLAKVVAGPEERARHLALGTAGPDEQVAATLDAAAGRALARGALAAAADAARLAVRATAAGDPRRSPRQVAHGQLMFRLGDAAGSVRELHAAVDQAGDDHARARALLALAKVSLATDSQYEAMGRALDALKLTDADETLALELFIVLADLAPNADDAAAYARRALAILERQPHPQPAQLAATLSQVFYSDFVAGLPVDTRLVERAIELEEATIAPPIRDRAARFQAMYYLMTDDSVRAEQLLDQLERIAHDEDDSTGIVAVAHLRSSLAMNTGRIEEAQRWTQEAIRVATASGLSGEERAAQWRTGRLLAYRGQVADAAAFARAHLDPDSDDVIAELHPRILLGYCAWLRDDHPESVLQFERTLQILDHLALRQPTHYRWITEHYVESLIKVGRTDDARTVTDAYEQNAAALGRTSALAAAARCRALLAADAGDVVAALAAIDAALHWHKSVERPIEQARTLLMRGQIHRRFRQSGAARSALTSALAKFEHLGLPGMADRTRAELARVSLRRASATHELTETERCVATLTAQGMTAAQAAAVLFISPKTVSANLTKVYRKLGVRNRLELATRLAAGPTDHAPSAPRPTTPS